MSESATQTRPTSIAPPIEDMLHLIQPVARSIHSKLPAFVELGDLEQAGYFGLVKALEKFDPDQAGTFETYAKLKIASAIRDYLRKNDATSRGARARQKKVAKLKRKLANENGCVPDSQQMAEACGLSLAEYRELELKLSGEGFHTEQFALLDQEEPDKVIDPPDSYSRNAEQEMLWHERDALIYSALEELPDRDRVILLFYIQSNFSMAEVGALMGINESRVSQIVKRARQILAPIFYSYRLGSY